MTNISAITLLICGLILSVDCRSTTFRTFQKQDHLKSFLPNDGDEAMIVPSSEPTQEPTDFPLTLDPTVPPTESDTHFPIDLSSQAPSRSPSQLPTNESSASPTLTQTSSPTLIPTILPSDDPTGQPTIVPTSYPQTSAPSDHPSVSPTFVPTRLPSAFPTREAPSSSPSASRTDTPTSGPSNMPTLFPTDILSSIPPTTTQPSSQPTFPPTERFVHFPSTSPSLSPSIFPFSSPTTLPSSTPTRSPSSSPTLSPTGEPSRFLSSSPSVFLSLLPSSSRSGSPSTDPTGLPTAVPTLSPSHSPSNIPSIAPSPVPTASPTGSPFAMPTGLPTNIPRLSPSQSPSTSPSEFLSLFPSSIPSTSPSTIPTVSSTSEQTRLPTDLPTFGCNFDRFRDPILETVDDILEDSKIDVDESGPGLTTGDVYVFERNQLETPGIGLDGFISGRCIVLDASVDPDFVHCQIIQEYPEGAVAFSGIFTNMSILGGDDCYTGISGSVDVDPVASVGYEYNILPMNQTPTGCDDAQKFFDTPWIESTGDTFLDIDRSGTVSVGDVIVFDNNEVVAGTRIGLIAGECILLPDELSFCSITYEFDDGIIQAEGTDLFLVITGGTGCFYGTSGSIAGNLISPGNYEYSVTIDDDSTSNTECTAGVFDSVWIESVDDVFVDFDRNNALSPGDIFVFDNNEFQVGGTGLVGLLHGKCIVLIPGGVDNEDVFCSITFELGEGAIAVQGFLTDMIITGATGCFRDLQGNVRGFEVSENEFGYAFAL